MTHGKWDAASIKALKKRHLLHPNTALAENEAGSPLPIMVAGIRNHGFTYSGHPVGTVVAMENIRILAEDGADAQWKEEAQ